MLPNRTSAATVNVLCHVRMPNYLLAYVKSWTAVVCRYLTDIVCGDRARKLDRLSQRIGFAVLSVFLKCNI